MNDAEQKSDFESDVRGYWYEWGVCEGLAGDSFEHRAADAWLQGLSLSDHLNPAQITPDNGKLICAGLGVAFGKLAQSSSDCPFAKARRAAAYLGRLMGDDPRATRYFDLHDREADELKTPRPGHVTEAIAWLTAGVAQAGRELQDPFLKALLEPDQVSFKMLNDILSPKSSSKALTLQSAESARPSRETLSAAELLQRLRPANDPIQIGVERVIKEAWKAVPPDTAPGNRLRLAIQKAKQSILRLSPSIKRQVSAHFQTKGWEPLKSNDPDEQKSLVRLEASSEDWD